MSLSKNLVLIALALSPVVSQAAAVRFDTDEEIAVQKVTQAIVQNDLKFVTAPSNNVCGNSGLEGTDVKVQIAAAGRYITIRHYGVTYAGFMKREKAIECAN
jgi:hypothetical protein